MDGWMDGWMRGRTLYVLEDVKIHPRAKESTSYIEDELLST